MKTKHVRAGMAAAFAVIGCLSLACDDDTNVTSNDGGTGSGGRAGTGTGGTGGTTGGGGTGGAMATLDDPQIAGVMLEANTGEVHAAEIAQARSNNASVRDFAAMMIMDHGNASRALQTMMDTQGMIATDSSTRRNLDAQATNTMNMLWTVNAAGFDAAYADSQVTMHTMVLGLLDVMLIPRAQNTALKTELDAARPKVAAHLQMAQQLRASLPTPGAQQ
jgi:putative membrane protein